jgi:hypothetical protein
MLKMPKIKIKYLLPLVAFLFVVNYFIFENSLKDQFLVERTNDTVAAILQENNIEVKSVPAIYNIKDKERINFLSNQEIRNKAQKYDQIVYYEKENMIVLYRPETKSIVSATTLVK